MRARARVRTRVRVHLRARACVRLQAWLLHFYSALALRESVLLSNGSHIRAWWIRHHFFFIGLSLVMLTCSYASEPCRAFMQRFNVWACFQGLIMLLQNRYQRQVRARTRACARVCVCMCARVCAHAFARVGVSVLGSDARTRVKGLTGTRGHVHTRGHAHTPMRAHTRPRAHSARTRASR